MWYNADLWNGPKASSHFRSFIADKLQSFGLLENTKETLFKNPLLVLVADHCHMTGQQNCHICDDFSCGDNLNRPDRQGTP
jgi:hypothetical protein